MSRRVSTVSEPDFGRVCLRFAASGPFLSRAASKSLIVRSHFCYPFVLLYIPVLFGTPKPVRHPPWWGCLLHQSEVGDLRSCATLRWDTSLGKASKSAINPLPFSVTPLFTCTHHVLLARPPLSLDWAAELRDGLRAFGSLSSTPGVIISDVIEMSRDHVPGKVLTQSARPGWDPAWRLSRRGSIRRRSLRRRKTLPQWRVLSAR